MYWLPMRNPKMAPTDTSGDWGVINGPLPYQWGGTWMGVLKDCKIRKQPRISSNSPPWTKHNLFNWATGVYTNEYLKAIDPDDR